MPVALVELELEETLELTLLLLLLGTRLDEVATWLLELLVATLELDEALLLVLLDLRLEDGLLLDDSLEGLAFLLVDVTVILFCV